MPIYVLEPTPQESLGWDEYIGFTVRANSEKQARSLAAKAAEDDGIKSRWTDPLRTTCLEVHPNGIPAVLLDSYRAG